MTSRKLPAGLKFMPTLPTEADRDAAVWCVCAILWKLHRHSVVNAITLTCHLACAQYDPMVLTFDVARAVQTGGFPAPYSADERPPAGSIWSAALSMYSGFVMHGRSRADDARLGAIIAEMRRDSEKGLHGQR